MYPIKRFLIFLICLDYCQCESARNEQGTVTSEFGRISNIDNKNIYVSASLSLTNCIRQCVDFVINHWEYTSENCFAYNYDTRNYTCELIHSIKPLNYQINFRAKWLAGFKYES